MTPRTLPSQTEAEFQATVVATLRALGWKHNHTRRTIGRGKKWVTATSCIGFPDLLCWHPVQRRTLAIELKSERGATTPEQVAVLASMAAAGVETMVARPSDFDALVALLRRSPVSLEEAPEERQNSELDGTNPSPAAPEETQ